jgi:chorismate mutase / prephenate dehydratase
VTELRAAVDRIDREMVAQINERANLVLEIGKLKEATNQPVFVPGREEEILARVVELSKGPLSSDSMRAVFREIISGSRQLERRLRVAFLGPLYTYSHIATLHRFGQSVELIPVGSIAAVFEEVHRKQADYGLVPIENSTDGRIADTLDTFTRLRVRICGEVQLRVHHALLGRCPRSDVTEVYSKPQALSQCRNWLVKHLPAARPIEVTSTSAAAQIAFDKSGAAAIASVQAAAQYGLEIIAESIEDNPDNITRFAVIGADAAPRSGRDKTAAMFQIEHRPGSLAEAINIFKKNRLNLTWIESFPISHGEYLFFIELDGHESDLKVRRALQALAKKTLRFEILGSCPRTEPVG